MFRPKVPTMPQPTGLAIPPTVTVEPVVTAQHPVQAVQAVVPSPAPSRPAIQITPGAVIALIGGGTAVVLVLGAVLVSMLLAVALTGTSLAICALVVRSLMSTGTKHR
ncbi:SpdD-like protein [Streptomyces sp. NBC_01431]|uniref:SpdD-like protein n=1 Tax=Streptomyces sp. NBC_01431 TaxID=2903863 RepID=UPI002E30C1BE|nr:SpdD-like protein [Streptomyces sp. NBC_01431]